MASVRKTYGFISHLKRSLSSSSTDNAQRKSSHRSVQLGKKGKTGIAVALIAVILVSAFIFFPRNTPATETSENTTDPMATINATNPPSSGPSNSNNGPTKVPFTPLQPLIDTITGKDRSAQVVTNAQTLNSSVWNKVAVYSWSYFQPGIGVDSRTGLPASGDTVGYFTDWDLGVYLQAIIDAQKIGLIGTDGQWGSSARIDKVMTFLENRELNPSHFPYWFYVNDGSVERTLSDRATEVCYTADTGRLFVALNNIKAYNSSFSNRIDNLVYNSYGNRSNYASLVPALKSESQTSTSIYAYYIISGFASFWPNQLRDAPAKILNNIMTSPPVKTPENVSLPNSRLTEDPLLCAIFELPNTTQLTTLSRQAYLAHEAFYNATNIYRAFGEGNTFTDAWAYEWIVYDGKTWDIRDASGAQLDINPIVYTKVAFSFLALYNTTYARNMVTFIEDRMENPSNGYSNGVDEIGAVLGATGLHTNGLILSAARYAIVNYP